MQQRILRRALIMFNKLSPQHTTMTDIAVSVGISKKTLYKNFQSKELLIHNVYAQLLNLTECRFRKILDKGDEPILELLNLCKQVLTFHHYFSPAVLQYFKRNDEQLFEEIALFTEHFFPTIFSFNIERGKGMQVFKKDLDGNIIAHLILIQLNAFNLKFDFLKNRYEQKEIQNQLRSYLLSGMTTKIGAGKAQEHLSNYSIFV